MKFKCAVCNKLTSGRKPKGGDGTFYYPRRHKGPDKKPCKGNIQEAIWFTDLPGFKKTIGKFWN